MAMREKDQADFDLETFVDLFDTAMSSDNPSVQRALKNLVLISAIVNAQENPDSMRRGPLRKIVDDIVSIRKRLEQLESAGAYRFTPQPITTSPGTAIPAGPWTGTTPPGYNKYPPVHPGQTQWPTTLPGTIPPGTIISGSSSSDTFKAQAVSSIDVQVGSLLEKLEAK